MSILSLISNETGIALNRLTLIVQTADFRYKSYTIPKRTGGNRLIQHPARELKFLQHWVIEHIFIYARVHRAATAYFKNASVRKNALIHSQGRFFLRVDFSDFFSSIKVTDITQLLRQISSDRLAALTDEDIDIIGKIVTRHGRLTIGAPSSPIISNAVMYEFDDVMTQLADQRACVYSRYADDIVFSTEAPRVLENLLQDVRQYVSSQGSPNLQINEKKVGFTSRKRRVRITGLILDCNNEISIGRNAKRKAKSLIHQFILGRLDAGQASYLKGYLGYIKGVEPKFLDALQKKYGHGAIDAIFHTQAVRLKAYDPLRLHQLFLATLSRESGSP
jgi:hypothetical protein